MDYSRIKVNVDISGTDIPRIQKGQAAGLRVATSPATNSGASSASST